MSLTVSVIIPTFNRRELLERAVRSVLPQLLPDDELIIVDDGSTDETADYLTTLPTTVRILRQEQRGAGAARNAGIALSRGDLLAFLDSDDEWLPSKLLLQREIMARFPDVLFAFSNFAVTDSAGALHRNFLVNWNKDPRGWDQILGPAQSVGVSPDFSASIHIGDLSTAELQRAYVLTSTLMARRSAGSALRFAEDVPTFEDLECFGRLSLSGTACYLDCETAIQHGQAANRLSGKSPLDQATSHYTIVNRVWGGDARFLAEHGALYRLVHRQAALQLCAELLTAARGDEARLILAQLETPPLHYRLLSLLPGK